MELLRLQHGESDLIYSRGTFYLAATCEIEESIPAEATDALGVDVGVANLATDSDGQCYSGSQTRSVRNRCRRLRAKLQKKQTRAAKRRLKKLSGKEQRFATYTNHVISKQIVACAKRTQRSIVLEDLRGIRLRIRARGKQRAVLHSWASLNCGSLSPIKRPWPECCSCWLIHAILRENAAALTHRKREPAQSIHLLLCRLPLCGERRWQRCFGNPKQGGCKPAEGFGPT